MVAELTEEERRILREELNKREFWTSKEAKDLIMRKLGLELSNDQTVELLENEFNKHFSIYRVSVGAVLAESGKKENKTYSLEEGEKAMWRRVEEGGA